VKGTVKVSQLPLPGATVTVNGKSAVTVSDGTYIIADVTSGSYNVTATCAGFDDYTSGNPVSVIAGGNVTHDLSMLAKAGTGVVTGTITSPSGTGLTGVTVTAGGVSQDTGADGSYFIANVAAGNQAFTAVKAAYRGYTGTVTVPDADVVTRNQALYASGYVYVANVDAGTILVIDLYTNKLRTVNPTLAGGLGTIHMLALTPDGAKLYAPGWGGSLKAVLTSDGSVSSVDLSAGSLFGVAVAPSGAYTVVASEAANVIKAVKVSDNSIIPNVATTGTGPDHMAFTRDGSKLYVANYASKTISVFTVTEAGGVPTFDLSATIDNPPSNVMFRPREVALSPDESFLYVANHDDDGNNHPIVKIDLSNNSVTAVAGTAADGEAIVFSHDGTRCYVAAYGGVNVYRTSDFTQIGNIWSMSAGRCGCIAVTPDDNYLYAAGWKSTYVAIFKKDGTKVEELSGFTSPYGVVIAP
jgi:DNA-binding beta-propeller fold protein YncE